PWVRLHVSLLRTDDGRPLHFVGQIEHIDALREQQEALARLAVTDPLTGLANRTAFSVQCERALSAAARHGRRTGLLLVDLDHFKAVNDTLGHQAGDALVVEVARRLRAVARPEDTVARLGGDEFVLLLEDLGSAADADRVADRVLAALGGPLELTGHGEVVVGCSIGVAVVDPAAGPCDPEELYRQADLALYRAKDGGRGRAARYDGDLRRTVDRRRRTDTALRRALAGAGVRVHYQPLVDLRTGRTEGLEALVRLSDGDLPAAEVVGLAEDVGLAPDLDAAVLRLVLDDVRSGRLPVHRVHVNVSPPSLASPRWQEVADVDVLRACGLALEVTERVLLSDGSSAAAYLQAVLAGGVPVGVDDFGTGYASLALLERYPLAFVKIDRTLVSRLHTDRARSLFAGVVGIAQALGMEAVAEGIETPDQLDAVRGAGCGYAQGHLLGLPVPAGELPARPARGRG
ncbi:MAG TPA: EAL domain-containing protein, partial [Mycobacteriales bacterium]|nr:EAL domain-containing protein [Mycobacteriales bacterium]